MSHVLAWMRGFWASEGLFHCLAFLGLWALLIFVGGVVFLVLAAWRLR